jgi:DNA polymerase I-like protein with 3'-5' exonuclease and polymerase domains
VAIIIDTSVGIPEDPTQNYWVYNGLDCCLTSEIASVLRPQVEADPSAKLIYTFERAMQAPSLEMTIRGVRVDPEAKAMAIADLQTKCHKIRTILDEFATAVWGTGLNPNSPKQLAAFFYDTLNLPPVMKRNKTTGKYGPSTDREALEKLWSYFYAKPFVNCILAFRDYNKKLGVLKTKIDPDGRMRAAYNVAGTETGRWSSSSNAFGTGSNFQNITEFLRPIFVADPGMKFAYIDLEQAESRAVAYISWAVAQVLGELSDADAEAYILGCEGHDLHTTVCQMVWQNLAWTGDLNTDRKEIAGQTFYRDYSYRDMAKRGGHGSNYYGQPPTMAMHLKVAKEVMERFQAGYFSAFPSIPYWHDATRTELQTKGQITTLMGRRRTFWGRRSDDATLRKAIAFNPQSSIGDIMNLGVYRLWRANIVQLLGQVHDAVWIQYPEAVEDEIIPKALELLTVSVPVRDRIMTIPCEADTGWNWGKFNPASNPDGLQTYKSHDNRTRTKLCDGSGSARSLLARRLP